MKKLIVLSLLSVFALGFSACTSSNPEAVAIDYVEKILNADFEGALDYMTDKSKAENKIGAEEMTKYRDETLRELEGHGGIKSVKALSCDTTQEDGISKARVQVQATFKDGFTETNPVYLVNVDGKWKVEE